MGEPARRQPAASECDVGTGGTGVDDSTVLPGCPSASQLAYKRQVEGFESVDSGVRSDGGRRERELGWVIGEAYPLVYALESSTWGCAKGYANLAQRQGVDDQDGRGMLLRQHQRDHAGMRRRSASRPIAPLDRAMKIVNPHGPAISAIPHLSRL
ncbi:hypothetical protein PLEOSDRAFT_163435 [Pleurotus ostreatus PC15]|uniref:Uncharacterized protein n=1 Tax=Pleurotus ostreatus (strain PC15) TaxID=1137138 RepID=A0A067NEI7_PLEO1|nr:hypothetical protein PLEOSDRAFT_163435 [Pleurotus ostreatus PC15]